MLVKHILIRQNSFRMTHRLLKRLKPTVLSFLTLKPETQPDKLELDYFAPIGLSC